MKKMLTLALAVVMMLSCSVTAMAATATEGANTVPVTYTENTSYTVTIPETITIDKNASEQTVSAKDVMIPTGTALKITVSSENYANNNWYVANKAAAAEKLTYTIKNGGTALKSGDTVLSVEAGNTAGASVPLTMQLTGNVTKAGTYTDTLTFTVSVEGSTAFVPTATNCEVKGADEMVISTNKDGSGASYTAVADAVYGKTGVYAANLSGWNGGISAKQTVIDPLGTVATGSGMTYWTDVRTALENNGYLYVAITLALDEGAKVQINNLIPNANGSYAEKPIQTGIILTAGSAPAYNAQITSDAQKDCFKIYSNGKQVTTADTIKAGQWYTVVVKLMQKSEIDQYTAEGSKNVYSNVCLTNANADKLIYVSEVRYYKGTEFATDFVG